MEGTVIVTPAPSEPEDVIAATVSVMSSIYGDRASDLVENQIQAAEGEMRQRWIAIRDALSKA